MPYPVEHLNEHIYMGIMNGLLFFEIIGLLLIAGLGYWICSMYVRRVKKSQKEKHPKRARWEGLVLGVGEPSGLMESPIAKLKKDKKLFPLVFELLYLDRYQDAIFVVDKANLGESTLAAIEQLAKDAWREVRRIKDIQDHESMEEVEKIKKRVVDELKKLAEESADLR